MVKKANQSQAGGPHLVLGGGTIGRRLARALASHGREVLVVSRSAPPQHAAIAHRSADVTSLDSLTAVATRATVIYNCVNPAYTTWGEAWPRISKVVNEYAVSARADLVICSNLYGYGPHDGPLTEDLPLKATWANGRARAEVWQESLALFEAGKLRVTEVRPSDFIVASAQSRMGLRVVPNLILGKKVQLLGALDRPHTWTDPDDVARLMVALAEDERSWGKPWHVPSNGPKTQREVVADIAATLHVSSYRVSPVGNFMESLLGLFNPLIRELNRGAYQFDRPFVMDSTAARTTFGLTPKPWARVIDDLVRPYLDLVQREGKEALAHLGNRSLENTETNGP